jgi:PKD repeat protein
MSTNDRPELPARSALSGRPARPWDPGHRGQALVELALLLPVMLLLLVAAADLGRIFYARIAVTNAARAGALEAGRHPSSYVPDAPCDASVNRVMCAVEAEAATMVTIAPTDVDVVCNPDPCAEALGNTITIQVVAHFDLLTPLLAVFTGGQSFDMTSTAAAQIAVEPIVSAASPGGAPTVAFYGSPVSGDAPLTVDFVDQSVGSPTGWSWDFGDSSSSTAQHPSHTYTNPGTYDVTLTVTNLTGNATLTKTAYVTVTAPSPSPGVSPSPSPSPGVSPSPSPSPSVGPSPSPLCFPPSADFVVSPSSGKKKKTDFQFTDLSSTTPDCPLVWSWNFGDGAGESSTSTLQNPTHVYESQGTYTVTLVASNAGGSDTRTRTVTVTP